MSVRQSLGGIFGKLFPQATNQTIKFNNAGNGAGSFDSATASASASAGMNIGRNSGVDGSRINYLSIFMYLIVILIILIVFLIFVDRYITPVFKYKPGTPGYIPLPYGDDGVLYWPKYPALIRDDKTIISNIASGITVSLDIFIFNPMAFAKNQRVLFWRGVRLLQGQPQPQPQPLPQSYNIPEFNLLYSLTKDTNDLMVSVMMDDSTNDNSNNTSPIETVKINNVPIRKGFRITSVLYNQLLEVYLNGQLIQTRPLPYPPKGSFHFLNGPQQEGAACSAVRNLKIWNRCLSSAEIREMSPPIDDFGDLDTTPANCANSTDALGLLGMSSDQSSSQSQQ
jgi:hypothetical protein